MTNIRDWKKFAESQWDWTVFNDCFTTLKGENTEIRISDIDGHVERKGHWLRIEGTEKKEIDRGQIRSIIRDAQRGTTIALLIGPANEPQEMRVYRPFETIPTVREVKSLGTIWFFIRGWFLWADANGWIDPRDEKSSESIM